MRIKELSERSGISKRNIHFYIKEGIISPETDRYNHYYDFSEDDLKKLQLLKALRNADVPLSVIRSIIIAPLSARYYINQHIKKLHTEKLHLEQSLISMRYIMDELPLYPDLSSVFNVCTSAGIPVRDRGEDFKSEPFDSYGAAIINMHLWGAFLPKENFTDYQEFLWLKLNRITLENPSDEYLRLGHFLNSMSNSRIEKLFSLQTNRYNYIVSLNNNTFQKCADEMVRTISSVISSEKYVSFWKANYVDYFYPCATIQASKLSMIVMELSPFFKKYVENVVVVCGLVYDYLFSSEGSELLNKLNSQLEGCLNLNKNNHGDLEALVILPEMTVLIGEH